MDNCTLQYKYPTKEQEKKYKIDCKDKKFENYKDIKKFNNKEFLEFIDDKYVSAFPEDSPFTFSEDYIKEDNIDLCNPTEYSLKPQQKFVGQIINPATNIDSSLVFHGLGSGKTCTSLVVGEAFKTTTTTKKIHLLYVVPAPLVQQYRDEIIGELKMIDENPEIWSCTSQCVITREQSEQGEEQGEEQGDFYTNTDDQSRLISLKDEYNRILNNKLKVSQEIAQLKLKKEPLNDKNKEFRDLENSLNEARNQYDNFKNEIMSKVLKVFEIVSHTKFIYDLFQVQRDGRWLKKKYLTDTNSPLLNKNSLLVIDEIQRLISAEGSLYKKLYTAIYQYAHPELRILLLSATPIYDNPYELALTMNILKPRIPFPLSKDKFYSFFLGSYDEDDNCVRVKGQNFINENSCLINKDLLRYLCSGYVSYFRGGNPNAYPYKRVITLEHKMSVYQKSEYIRALKSDISRDSSVYSKLSKEDSKLIELFSKNDFTESDDKISGIYVNTQQLSNIALPKIKSDIVDKLKANEIKKNLIAFKTELLNIKPKPVSYEHVLTYIRNKGYSEKFCKIIELSHESDGPVFIFSNWLQFGVEALSVILDACGYVKYTSNNKEQDKPKYFIWNSETSQDKDLVSKAKAQFNSLENKNGSKLKIILGTRSIMEGVSFKNVKQVHITDPWWNESRIEQILARAVRFCSHSQLPLEEQWTDIYRHYSILPLVNDPELTEALLEASGSKKFKSFNQFTIEQKMLRSSLKKSLINSEFDDILKQTAYDCDLNKKGNIIRLEEHIMPLSNGNFQIYFKNPNTLNVFLREGIPSEISFNEIQTRIYSYPNTDDLPLLFTECEMSSENKLVKIKRDKDPEILDDTNISKTLTLYENIPCWNNNETYEDIISIINKTDPDIGDYFNNTINNFNLMTKFRIEILGEKQLGNKIKFNTERQKSEQNRGKLFRCLQSTMENPETPQKLKVQIKKMLQSEESRPKIDKKIIDIIYTYKFLPETELENLINSDSKTILELHKEAERYFQNK